MTEYENAIELKNVTKKYDGFTLDNVSFTVAKGSIMGFIGQNGAGKTTTIRSILNIIGINSGEIKLLGLDHIKDEYAIKERIAVVFDELPFHDSFTGETLSKMFSGLYGSWDKDEFFRLCERFGLPVKKKLSKFSKGMKMKMQIATALSHNAELLIMDEATTGLDPIVRNEILDIFREYLMDGNRSILMSSHITSDLEKIADSVAFIDKGKILITGFKDDILDSHGIIKCTKDDFREIDPTDYISARISDFGAELMTPDRRVAAKKYSGAIIEKPTLEEIMLFYVNREKKEWS
ncbi:ABC transporter ATP-binding protein [Ruminococcus albus]|uniref:ABC transporter ATP-binding protein n=1 Tax=Ruminococcus albus TaxID=1264 RepID=UPI000466692F|nr:ABC transporter ATP-binding protein [Ruminococcus albus]